jgi:adenosylcobyric acid synthase
VTEDKSVRFSRNIALLGTASDVGKSLLTTAFCRLLSDAGLRVAPFKAQNMSNNAAVTLDGGEIGRAQYVQALAARVPSSVHHNPVLLKPVTDRTSQVIVHGKVHTTTGARDYFDRARQLRELAFSSLHHLRANHDVVVLEGAGGCAEVNLRSREFVNFAAAHEAQARVILVADIERGGVFAQVVGSLDLLSPADRARVCGVIINKFRGDPSLFDDGVQFLQERTGVPVLGVVPFLPDVGIDQEDSLAAPHSLGSYSRTAPIAVLAYPHLANFADFDALGLEEIAVHFIRHTTSLEGYAAVILPGSKAVGRDLAWLRRTGLARELARFIDGGGRVLGICGGMQMLGQRLLDPHHVESDETEVAGLGHLELTTQFQTTKIVGRRRGHFLVDADAPHDTRVEGYEIHHGVSHHAYPALFELWDPSTSRLPAKEGVRTSHVWGTYLHGLFDAPAFRHQFSRWVNADIPHLSPVHRTDALQTSIERFAAHVRTHLDWERIWKWASSPAS